MFYKLLFFSLTTLSPELGLAAAYDGYPDDPEIFPEEEVYKGADPEVSRELNRALDEVKYKYGNGTANFEEVFKSLTAETQAGMLRFVLNKHDFEFTSSFYDRDHFINKIHLLERLLNIHFVSHAKSARALSLKLLNKFPSAIVEWSESARNILALSENDFIKLTLNLLIKRISMRVEYAKNEEKDLATRPEAGTELRYEIQSILGLLKTKSRNPLTAKQKAYLKKLFIQRQRCRVMLKRQSKC